MCTPEQRKATDVTVDDRASYAWWLVHCYPQMSGEVVAAYVDIEISRVEAYAVAARRRRRSELLDVPITVIIGTMITIPLIVFGHVNFGLPTGFSLPHLMVWILANAQGVLFLRLQEDLRAQGVQASV